MDVSAIDRSATRGTGPLRLTAPGTKLLALALVLAAVLTSWNVLVLAGVFGTLLAAVIWGRLDVRLALSLAAYPSVFAVIFAFASAPDVHIGIAIVAKAVTAALAAVTVILSTPYPQVFAPLQRVTPGIVGDALLMTYRATFILLDKFSNLLRATRLRAGLRGGHPIRAARAGAAALGGLLLYSVDLAQRDYDIMRVRGYTGRLRVVPHRSANARVDAAVLVIASALPIVAVLWRTAAVALNPYSWIVPLPALGLIALAAWTRRDDR